VGRGTVGGGVVVGRWLDRPARTVFDCGFTLVDAGAGVQSWGHFIGQTDLD